jgi:hypothetical protein
MIRVILYRWENMAAAFGIYANQQWNIRVMFSVSIKVIKLGGYLSHLQALVLFIFKNV